MNALQKADSFRIEANVKLDPNTKAALGQFMTPAPICLFMASLFENIQGEVRLLEPGCGVGSLIAAFTERASESGLQQMSVTAYEIEDVMEAYLRETLNYCSRIMSPYSFDLRKTDFIHDATNLIENDLFTHGETGFSHVIMNPPYKKIRNSSSHRQTLRRAGIETVNLYTGFFALAIKLLRPGGEIVTIIPRSFCNGPYYQPFRVLLLKEMAIQHLHVFDCRKNAFAEDKVLQENIIIHCIKGAKQGDVTITSSPNADFQIDQETGEMTATDMTIRTVSIDKIVNPKDHQKFIHIAAKPSDQHVIDRLSSFTSTLEELEISVSTGPVVDFRLKEDLRQNPAPGTVPLIYPQHLRHGLRWPISTKKPNAIMVSEKSRPWLWKNRGYFVLTRRFSSKEEKRRIVASIYDSSLPGELIGFENKTNEFHAQKEGFTREVAAGLAAYLNSTLIDQYYRLFGGHTQVNATDLRSLPYPDLNTLRRISQAMFRLAVKESLSGELLPGEGLSQLDIDKIIDREIDLMTDKPGNNPLHAQQKIDEALDVLASIGMPRAQLNERSALTLLALLNLRPDGHWNSIQRPMMGVTPIMDWCKEVYGKEYAPNTRETFRRQTLHQFNDGGLILYNPDQPDRPVNSPKACYQITEELFEVLKTYGTDAWAVSFSEHLETITTLTAQYAMDREMQMIPLTLDDGTEIKLSPGRHSKLISEIINDFGPRFAPGSEVIYLGDTGAKEDFFRKDRLSDLGVTVDRKGKMPDVVLYWAERNWLLLIEAVTSHGPVDGKRHGELSSLFKDATPGIVYVTALPDRRTLAKYMADISWETEVWLADSPSHMIHLNGDRFLGPHG